MNTVITLRGKSYFVCEYTGAPCAVRYFIPSGKNGRGKLRCFASLPIMLRCIYEEQGNEFTADYSDVKRIVEEFYLQPDIPMAPALPVDRVPLSAAELDDYLLEGDMGMAWLHVGKGLKIEDAPVVKSTPKRPKKRLKR